MNFTKMHGIGNDYIYFNCFKENILNPEELSVRLSRRRFSVGSDGIILVCPSEIADAKMRIFNADGSEAKMCGNGIRCVGKFLYEKNIVKKESISVETLSGIKYLYLDIQNEKVISVTAKIGKADFHAASIPVLCSTDEFFNRRMTLAGREWNCSAVSVGNPHLVVFDNNIDSLELEKIGPLFEKHELFTENINTEFIQINRNGKIRMRVWERGSGETFACGTGASAVVSVCVRKELFPFNVPITVVLKGGELLISIDKHYEITMSGSAELSYEGFIED